MFPSVQSKAIYSIQFVPLKPPSLEPETEEKPDWIYTCSGDGNLWAFNMNNPNADPININEILLKLNPCLETDFGKGFPFLVSAHMFSKGYSEKNRAQIFHQF